MAVVIRSREWHDIRYAWPSKRLKALVAGFGALMGEVVRFVPRSELERAQLIREARAMYERVFPPAEQASERQDPKK
jgi:hypothetical protein